LHRLHPVIFQSVLKIGRESQYRHRINFLNYSLKAGNDLVKLSVPNLNDPHGNRRF
jgi:hypothetical protein